MLFRSNIQAAIGVSQIEKIDEHLARKRRMAALYSEKLRDVAGLRLPVERPQTKNVYWMYAVVLDDEVPFDAAELGKRLRQDGVDTRPFFAGMHEQPALLEQGLFKGEYYPVTERISRRGLYLPSGLGITDSQIESVCQALKRCLSR